MRISDTGTLATFTALADLIDHSPSPAHAVSFMGDVLKKVGSQELRQAEQWRLNPGGMYHLAVSERSLIAFRIPVKPAGRAPDRQCG